jgi:LacI family transcriptional regulator
MTPRPGRMAPRRGAGPYTATVRSRHIPTLRDVADQAGVHPGTVSRALNPATRSMVNEATARRVLVAAETLGYRPNSIARGLRTNRSSTVGVLVPDITNPFFPPILRGIEDTLAEAGYTTLIANTDNEAERERMGYEAFLGRHVDGLITATAWLHDELLDEAFQARVPMVLMNRRLGRSGASAVCTDDDLGIKLVVDHLVGLGHRSIAHLAGRMALSTAFARHRAFTYAMEAHDQAVDPGLIVICDRLTEEEGEKQTLALLDQGRPFTAIVAANDMLALGAYDALAKRGLSCPADLSVVGYNDVRFMDKLQPPLTTVRVPKQDLGREAARMLLEQLAHEDAPPRLMLLQPELVVRGSTGPPPSRPR